MSYYKIEKGKKYEEFVKKILMLGFLKFNDGIEFDREWDKGDKILGKSGTKHQIDIHLISSKNPEYHLIGECKCYKGPIEKYLGCSFVTVINDIKKEHKDWKIIPIFCSSNGFESGTYSILNFNKILAFDLKDVKDVKKTLSITTKSHQLDVQITNIVLKDGTTADVNEDIINYDLGDTRPAKWVIGYYKLYNKKGKLIKELMEHEGYFKTGDRLYVLSEYDKFLTYNGKKEIKYIEGIANGYKEVDIGSESSILTSDISAKLVIDKKWIVKVYKNGRITKEKYIKK